MAGDLLRVELTRSGGFLGLSTQFVVDTVGMNDAEAASFRNLVEEAEADAPLTESPGMPDQYSYDLVIQRGSHRSTIHLTDAGATSAQRKLLAELRRRAI
jgi:hypothetical protein